MCHICSCRCPGNGTQAAIGRLTRLTSLHLALSPVDEDELQPPLQLQLLGGSAAANAAGGGGESSASDSSAGDGVITISDSSVSGGVSTTDDSSGHSLQGCNTGLRELSLEAMAQLSDDELAAAAGALPDLTRLDVFRRNEGDSDPPSPNGAGLAAFRACQHLRDISMRRCPLLSGQQLVQQLPRISSLASLEIIHCPCVESSAIRDCRQRSKPRTVAICRCITRAGSW